MKHIPDESIYRKKLERSVGETKILLKYCAHKFSGEREREKEIPKKNIHAKKNKLKYFFSFFISFGSSTQFEPISYRIITLWLSRLKMFSLWWEKKTFIFTTFFPFSLFLTTSYRIIKKTNSRQQQQETTSK